MGIRELQMSSYDDMDPSLWSFPGDERTVGLNNDHYQVALQKSQLVLGV
jgi:hypothetical protein